MGLAANTEYDRNRLTVEDRFSQDDLAGDNSTHSGAAGCSQEGELTEEGEPPEVLEIAGRLEYDGENRKVEWDDG